MKPFAPSTDQPRPPVTYSVTPCLRKQSPPIELDATSIGVPKLHHPSILSDPTSTHEAYLTTLPTMNSFHERNPTDICTILAPLPEPSASVRTPSPSVVAIKASKQLLHHPRQVSHNASQVFSVRGQKPSPSTSIIKRPQPGPITSFSSYQAYEAACALIPQATPLLPSSASKGAVEGLQHAAADTAADTSDGSRTCSLTLPAPNVDAQLRFVAARLPTFVQKSPSPAIELAGSPDVFNSGSDSPVIGSLFDLPSPPFQPLTSTLSIPIIINKWAEEKTEKQRKSCRLYHRKSASALDEPDFDLAGFLNQASDPLKKDEDKAMQDLCAAMNALDVSDQCGVADHVNTENPLQAYGFEYADLDDGWDTYNHVVDDCANKLHDAPVIVDYEEISDAEDWGLISPANTFARSDFESDSDFDLNRDIDSEDEDDEWYTTDHATRAFAFDLRQALKVPLPASPSTEDLVRQDTEEAKQAMKTLAEYDGGFTELTGCDWNDEFEVSVDAWSNGRFRKQEQGKDTNPFMTFPLIDGQAVGGESMDL